MSVTTAAPATAPVTTADTTPSATARPRTTPRGAPAASSGRRACDANVTVKASTTSCAFGENVFYGYWKAQGDDAFTAYSPVSRRSYPMDCTIGTTVVCRAGDGGEVRFPQAAIDSYDGAQAARYAATHDTGPSAAPPSSSSSGSDGAASVPDSGGSSCDPNYEGACLDPDAVDYDCKGGSGDGPKYTGTVTVVGDDRYGLDADGNGVGCE
jgi:hypothetical protein